MATLYGDEPKFLQIVDFIEYYKLQGATFFHIYLRNVTDYDRVLLDDYVRTGDIEIIKMHDHYWRDDFMWHNSQINVRIILETTFISCFRIVIIETNTFLNGRQLLILMNELKYEMILTELLQTIWSKHLSMQKCIINLKFFSTVHNSSIVNLHFLVQWVIKQNNTPARYESDEQVIHFFKLKKPKISAYSRDDLPQISEHIQSWRSLESTEVYNPSRKDWSNDNSFTNCCL